MLIDELAMGPATDESADICVLGLVSLPPAVLQEMRVWTSPKDVALDYRLTGFEVQAAELRPFLPQLLSDLVGGDPSAGAQLECGGGNGAARIALLDVLAAQGVVELLDIGACSTMQTWRLTQKGRASIRAGCAVSMPQPIFAPPPVDKPKADMSVWELLLCLDQQGWNHALRRNRKNIDPNCLGGCEDLVLVAIGGGRAVSFVFGVFGKREV